MIFIQAQQGSARRDVADLIYKGNMLDRATPVRNMIGALAVAKQLDYRQTYGAPVGAVLPRVSGQDLVMLDAEPHPPRR